MVLGLLVVAAGLEAFAGYCLGCQAFAMLMRAGIIPESVCAECRDLRGRRALKRDHQEDRQAKDRQVKDRQVKAPA